MSRDQKYKEESVQEVEPMLPEATLMNFSRKVLRQSSLILPTTGERVHSFQNTQLIQDLSDGQLIPISSMNASERDNGRLSNWRSKALDFLKDEKFHNVLKCSTAYLLASLGVYNLKFDTILGKSDFKHVVATVAVYYHPARTKGSMFQSLIFVTVSLVFSFSVSFACRYISSIFYNHGEDEVSNIIDLTLSSIALGVVAFMKQKVGKQTFNTACSLASISIVACIVKEGSLNSADIPLERLFSTLKIVVTGCCFTVAICYILWPMSAIDELRLALNDSFNIFSKLLLKASGAFLDGKTFSMKDNELFNSMKKNISTLYKNLEEAKYELNVKGREQEYEVFEKMLEITTSLGRHLQAMHSSAEMQWKLLHKDELNLGTSQLSRIGTISTLSEATTSSVNFVPSDESTPQTATAPNDYATTSAELFDLFVYFLGPSMRSFVYTINCILGEVPFESKNNLKAFLNNVNFQNSIKSAIELFKEKQESSFERLYSQNIFKANLDFTSKTNQEEVMACCGNFAYLLILFGEEFNHFLELDQRYEDSRKNPPSWDWLKFWNYFERKKHNVHMPENSLADALSALYSQSRSVTMRRDRLFAGNLLFRFWKSLRVLRRTEVQFGIRVGLGALFLSSFAFYKRTKEFFNVWRLEWALTIYCIMMNKSLGGTTMTVKFRFIGTFLGAATAYLVWTVFGGNAYALAISGFLLSFPCFNIIIHWPSNNAFGRFILLTYNLTALYSYSMTEKDTEDGNEGGDNPIVGEIAFHRFVSVSIGIIWALTMASCFIPNSARTRLKNGIIILWLRLGATWNIGPLDYYETNNRKYLHGLKDEEGINSLLYECETLLKQAPLEFRLKGSFPKDTYTQLLKCTSTIIDAYQNMRLMIDADEILSKNEEYVLRHTQEERDELEDRLFLTFYMIASAMKLSLPLPRKPASTQHARDRMLLKLSETRNRSNPDMALKNEDYVLLYSYTSVASIIAEELDKIISLIKDLLGDISEEAFELF